MDSQVEKFNGEQKNTIVSICDGLGEDINNVKYYVGYWNERASSNQLVNFIYDPWQVQERNGISRRQMLKSEKGRGLCKQICFVLDNRGFL